MGRSSELPGDVRCLGAPALQGTDIVTAATKRMAPVGRLQHDGCRLCEAAALRLPAVAGQLRAGVARVVRDRADGRGASSITAVSSGPLLDGGYSGYVAYEMCSPLRGGGGAAERGTSTAAPAAF